MTKITEASSHSSVRSAIANVLKKYGYTLEVMEVRFTNTMQVSALLINGSGQGRSCYNYYGYWLVSMLSVSVFSDCKLFTNAKLSQHGGWVG